MIAAQTIAQLYTDVEFCEAAVSDKEMHDFVQWLKVLLSFESITQAATENMHLHYQEIEYRTAASKALLFGPAEPKGLTYEFGYSLGDVAFYSLGPMRKGTIAAETPEAFLQ